MLLLSPFLDMCMCMCVCLCDKTKQTKEWCEKRYWRHLRIFLSFFWCFRSNNRLGGAVKYFSYADMQASWLTVLSDTFLNSYSSSAGGWIFFFFWTLGVNPLTPPQFSCYSWGFIQAICCGWGMLTVTHTQTHSYSWACALIVSICSPLCCAAVMLLANLLFSLQSSLSPPHPGRAAFNQLHTPHMCSQKTQWPLQSQCYHCWGPLNGPCVTLGPPCVIRCYNQTTKGLCMLWLSRIWLRISMLQENDIWKYS